MQLLFQEHCGSQCEIPVLNDAELHACCGCSAEVFHQVFSARIFEQCHSFGSTGADEEEDKGCLHLKYLPSAFPVLLDFSLMLETNCNPTVR